MSHRPPPRPHAPALAALCAAAVVSCTDDDAGEGHGLGSANPRGVLTSLAVRDVSTDARYDALGRPLSSSAAPLRPLAGYHQFWFAWSIFNHSSEVFGRDRSVQTAPISHGGDCAVPCDELRPGCFGKDCIPALTAPDQVAPESPDAAYLSANSFVVGVVADGEARAYPHNILWHHEIVNDQIRGQAVAITHCPLTFSSVGHDPTGFISSATVELGVSGLLYNSNLVFYNRSDDTLYSQLLGIGTAGPGLDQPAPRQHLWEMSWAAWRAMHPATTVLSSRTGHARDYQRYPYGSYFTDDSDTFSATNPAPDPLFPNKAHTYGLRIGTAAKAYVHSELAAWAAATYGADAPAAGVVNDQLAGTKLALVFDIDAGYVQAFDRTGEADLELSW